MNVEDLARFHRYYHILKILPETYRRKGSRSAEWKRRSIDDVENDSDNATKKFSILVSCGFSLFFFYFSFRYHEKKKSRAQTTLHETTQRTNLRSMSASIVFSSSFSYKFTSNSKSPENHRKLSHGSVVHKLSIWTSLMLS